MVIRREWTVGCICPDCGQTMAPLVRIQEQYYPEAHNMPEHTVLTPSMYGMSVEHVRCGQCGVVHDIARLEPVLKLVDLSR